MIHTPKTCTAVFFAVYHTTRIPIKDLLLAVGNVILIVLPTHAFVRLGGANSPGPTAVARTTYTQPG